MPSLAPRRNPLRDDGVSAVIGVILMVAITVAIAATVYIWAGGFGTGGDGPESASATAKAESYDGDSRAEWIKFTLTNGGENAPYVNESVSIEVVAGGDVFSFVCDNPSTATTQKCEDYFEDSTDDANDIWEVGSSKYFPCQNTNRHSVTVAIRDQVVMDRTVSCQQAA